MLLGDDVVSGETVSSLKEFLMEEVLLIVLQIPNPSSHYLPSRSLLIRGNIRERLAVDRSIVNVRTSRLARPKIYRSRQSRWLCRAAVASVSSARKRSCSSYHLRAIKKQTKRSNQPQTST